mmetsp:Transcript_33821/g.49106  ORF Transcript_33821/g.49106 Transcript_33821/m.49106 type:complete len:441 (-) Transcript_33821:598-1920(-)
MLLRTVTPDEVKEMHFDPVDPVARDQAAAILADIRLNGLEGLIDTAVRLKDLETKESKIYYTLAELKPYFDSLDEKAKGVLQRTADRIKSFAEAQRNSISTMTTNVVGGSAGHYISPIEVAGCYAPGGRYPLPSSVLMTAVTARAAGVKTVIVASPRPAAATFAAAYVAGVDALLAIGGAQAVAALAYGVGPVPRCDVIVGPGNKWVTAAKSLVSGICGIDMLAGPSEVLVIADKSCDPNFVAADLLAQAEHDTEARPILVCTDLEVVQSIDACLKTRLETLPSAPTASEALKKGYACICSDIDTAIGVSNIVGPEHLEIHTFNPEEVAKKCTNYGAVFIGAVSAEVLGDYGVGPNHVLPTCGTSRYTGGLSVFTFLRIRTWMNIVDRSAAQDVIQDCVHLARMEGLEGHARAAECRLLSSVDVQADDDNESSAKKAKIA